LSAFFHLLAFVLKTLFHWYTVVSDFLDHRYWLLELICPVDYQAITQKQLLLKKKPQHLAIVMDSDDVSIPDLANLLTWAIAFNILCITIYDMKGVLKAQKATLQATLSANNSKIFGYHLNPIVHYEKSQLEILQAQTLQNMINPDQTHTTTPTSKTQSDHRYKQTASITITSVEDGMDCIIMCIKKLALAAQQGLIQPHQIQGYNFMNHALASRDGVISEPPDFVMKFGNNIVQSGFLPWQTRYSEILQMGSIKYLSFQTFWSALLFFSDCNQRFGK